MSILNSAVRTRKDVARKIVVYGGNGVGKSTFPASAPNPIYIRPEDNLAHLDVVALPAPRTFEELTAQLAAVHGDQHGYETLVIDTLDEVQKSIEAAICEAGSKKSFADFGFGKGEKLARDYWQSIMDWIDAIVRDRHMTVVMLAHADVVRFSNPEGDDFDKYNMRLHKWATNEFRKWANDVLFAQMPVVAKSQGEVTAGFGKAKKVGQSTGRRILRTVESGACFAKNQCGLPPEIPLSWAEYAKYAFPNGQPAPDVNYDTGEAARAGVDQAEMDEVAAATESADDGAFCSDTVESVEGGGQ